jgi:hypothetical protein
MVFPGADMVDAIDERDSIPADSESPSGSALSSGCTGSQFIRGEEGYNYCGPEAEGGTDSAVCDKDPSPRVISNAFHSDVNIPNSIRASDWLWQWGQFVDHDYALGAETGPHLEILIPDGDEFYPSNFHEFETERTEAAIETIDGEEVKQQINSITSFIDAGNVYGNTNFRAEFLKANDGSGRMNTSDGNLLPLAGDVEAHQELTARFENRNNADQPRSEFFVAGDARVNEHVNLITVHTLLHREHNYWADIIRAENPDLTGDEVFDLARIIVQSEVQKVTYDEFLALLLGPDAIPPYTGFDPNANPGALNVGAACAFRVGHTLISPSTNFVDDSGNANAIPFETGFWNPQLIKDHGLDPFMRGLQTQVCQEVDVHLQSSLRNDLFALNPDSPPRDLYSLNIERAREHGIPNYNELRRAYLGEDRVLPSGTDIFGDDSVFTPSAGEILSTLYDGPDSVDCFPGILAEVHVAGAMVGELHLAILSQQFAAIRDGDEFWYQNRLQGQLLQMIEDTTLADIIKRNSDSPGSLDDLGDNAFIVPE